MDDLSNRTASVAARSTPRGQSPPRLSAETRFQVHSLSPNPIGIGPTFAA
jgi:hypothetical protein